MKKINKQERIKDLVARIILNAVIITALIGVATVASLSHNENSHTGFHSAKGH
jgi:hypothetical protein